MFPVSHQKMLGNIQKNTKMEWKKEKAHEQEFNASTSSSTNAPRPFFWTPQKWAFTWSPPTTLGKIRNNKQIPACHVINPKITDMIREPNTLGSTGSTPKPGHGPGTLPPPHTNSRPEFFGLMNHWFCLIRPYEPTPYFWGGYVRGG